MKACFMGLGYIGLPTAIIAAKHGIQITGVDINPHVVEMTNAGHLHIIEPGMEKMLQEVVKTGMLKASVTPEVSDAYFKVVPTPFKGNHEPDVSYVQSPPTRFLGDFRHFQGFSRLFVPFGLLRPLCASYRLQHALVLDTPVLPQAAGLPLALYLFFSGGCTVPA